MQTSKKLTIENLERREVFSVAPGFEGLTPDTQVTDQEIIDALNAGTQLTAEHGVDSPRDAASGMASGKRLAAVAQVTDQEIIDALNNGTQLTSDALVVTDSGYVGFIDGSDVGFSVGSPRDVASGAASGKRHEIVLGSLDGDFAAVDQLFADYQVTAPGTAISGL